MDLQDLTGYMFETSYVVKENRTLSLECCSPWGDQDGLIVRGVEVHQHDTALQALRKNWQQVDAQLGRGYGHIRRRNA